MKMENFRSAQISFLLIPLGLFQCAAQSRHWPQTIKGQEEHNSTISLLTGLCPLIGKGQSGKPALGLVLETDLIPDSEVLFSIINGAGKEG